MNTCRQNEDSLRSKGQLRKSSRIIRIPGDNSKSVDASFWKGSKDMSKAEKFIGYIEQDKSRIDSATKRKVEKEIAPISSGKYYDEIPLQDVFDVVRKTGKVINIEFDLTSLARKPEWYSLRKVNVECLDILKHFPC